VYLAKLKHYTKIEWVVLPNHKSHGSNAAQIKKEEAIILKPYMQQADVNVLLDERGKSFDSIEFASKLETYKNSSIKSLNFYIGGAYGFDDSIKNDANLLISFSSFTFTHLMIRLLLVEQLYRAFTINNHEKYHHL
jgi:23S rRNA (pseudouridine1915-N3)-methyltransferase